jgi:hypothetical protein
MEHLLHAERAREGEPFAPGGEASSRECRREVARGEERRRVAASKPVLKRFLAVWVWLGLVLALPASAAPVTYSFGTGFATIRAVRLDDLTEVLAPTEVPLSGAYVTFDDATITLTDFLVTVPATGTIALAVPYGGNTQFAIESASLQPGGGFATLFGSEDAPGQYSFLAGPVDIDGVYSVPPDVMSYWVPFTDDGFISGSIDINLGQFTLTGITLTELPAEAFGEAADLQVKADITFVGMFLIPEPGTASLLGLGFIGIAAARRRALK